MVLYETEQERKLEKKPVGQDYYPLSDHKDIQEMVFNPALANKPTPFMRPRPKDAPLGKKTPLPQSKPMQQIGYEESKGNNNYSIGQTMDPSLDKYHPDQKVIMKGQPREGFGGVKPSIGKVVSSKPGITTKTGTGLGTGNKISSLSKVGTGSLNKNGPSKIGADKGDKGTDSTKPPTLKSGFKPVYD